MANIPVYDPSAQLARGLEIPRGGAEAYGMAARHVSAELRVAGESLGRAGETYGQHEVQQESASIETDKANALDPLTQGINDALSKAPQGKEHDALAAYLSGPGADLINKIGANADTTEGQHRAAQARAELGSYAFRFGHSAVSMISAVNVKNAINSGANVYAQQAGQGFMSLADARVNTQALIDSSIRSAPDLSAEDQAGVRDTLTTEKMHGIDMAYGLGLAKRDPVALGEAIAKGALPNLSGEEVSTLERASQSDARQQQEDFLRQRKLTNESRQNQYLTNAVDPQSGQLNLPSNVDILRDPDLTPEGKRQMMATVKHLSEPEAMKTNPQLLNHLLQRTLLPTTDPNHLSQAEALGYVGKGLTPENFNFITSRLNPKTPEDFVEKELMKQTLAQARAQLVTRDPLTLQPSPEGEMSYSRFLGWFLPAYQGAINKGGSAPDLLNPASQHYMLGRDGATLGHFAGSTEDAFQAQLRANQHAAGTKPAATNPALTAPPGSPERLQQLHALLGH